jgi:hypothetical protein
MTRFAIPDEDTERRLLIGRDETRKLWKRLGFTEEQSVEASRWACVSCYPRVDVSKNNS